MNRGIYQLPKNVFILHGIIDRLQAMSYNCDSQSNQVDELNVFGDEEIHKAWWFAFYKH